MEKKQKSKLEKLQEHPNVKGQVLPHSEEAEKGLLCSFLLDDRAVVDCLPRLKKEDFYYKSHEVIFSAMCNIYKSSQRIDIVSVTKELDVMGETVNAGGANYVIDLTMYQSSSANYMHYFKIIKKDGMLRNLAQGAADILTYCFAGDAEDKALVHAEQIITSVAEDNGIKAMVPFADAAASAIQEINDTMLNPDGNRGLQTGFHVLNDYLGGLNKGDLIIIAARPGQGKTSIGMNLVQQVATAHIGIDKNMKVTAEPAVCAVFSLEMPKEQLAKRMLCSMARVELGKAKKGQIESSDDWARLAKANAALAKSKIFIDDTATTTPAEIVSKCRRLIREQGKLDLVMIDYLTLMTSGDSRKENRQQDVSEMSRQLKLAAKELKVPILLLSQLSRESEKNKRRPIMSDLRESGAIEQDADIITFIYRPNMLGDENATDKNKAEFIVAKNRNGEQGIVPLIWEGPYVSFAEDNSVQVDSN